MGETARAERASQVVRHAMPIKLSDHSAPNYTYVPSIIGFCAFIQEGYTCGRKT